MSDKMNYVDVIKYALMLTVLYIFLFIISFSLLIFQNSLYFSLLLIVFSMWSLRCLVWFGLFRSLTAFLLIIVYVGAIMILIGYICAVSPNFRIEPDYTFIFFGLFFSILIRFFVPFSVREYSFAGVYLVDYFYSPIGLLVFISLVVILFVTLLIVTSHYLISCSPLRRF